MNIKNKIASNQEELEEFLTYQLLGRKSISEIVEYDTLISILENIEQYIDESVDKYKIDIIKDEDDLYVITKEEYEGHIILEVNSLFIFNDDSEDYDITYIDSDVLYIEDVEYNMIDELQEELEDSICCDEVFNLYVDEEDEELDTTNQSKCYECEGCACYCDNTEEEGLGEEIEEFLTEKLQDYYNDEIDIRSLLRNIYSVAFRDGENSALIGIRDSLTEILED